MLVSSFISKFDTDEDYYGIALTSVPIIFKGTNVSNSSDAKLNDDTTDVTLMVNNHIIKSHKNILASNSEYFDTMFTSNFKEQNQDKIVINIIELRYETIKTLLEFFYSSVLIINETNVQDLLIGSSILLVEDVQKACINYIKTMIDIGNCFELKEMSNCLRINELHSICMNFITKNFKHVIDNKALMNNTYEEMMSLIKDDNLFAKEELVYDLVINWVRHDEKVRGIYNSELLWYVRLPLILNTYQGTSMIMDYQCAKLDSVISFRTEYRQPFRKGILLISHYPSISSLEWFDATTEQWQQCMSEDCQCTNFKVVLEPPAYLSTNVLLDTGFVFSVGGEENEHGMRSAFLFDPRIAHWIFMPPMKYFRIKPCVVQMGPKVYVIGGCSKLTSQNVIEYYDLNENKWFPAKCKIRGYTSAKDGIFAARVNKLIYVICKNVAGYYDTESDEWQSISPLPRQKYGSAVCVLNANIYVIGGHKKEVYFKSVWAYCTQTKVWVSVADLNSPRSNAGVAVMNGYIYVFGGKTGPSSHSSTFEVYNPHRNEWVTSDAHMSLARSYSDAIVIEKSSVLYKKVFEDATNLMH